LVAAEKFLVAATRNLFVVPYFVAVTKPFFSVNSVVKLVLVVGNSCSRFVYTRLGSVSLGG